MGDYIAGRTTTTSRLVQVSETEFPTITICMDPPLKPSVMSKYGFKSLEEVVINDVPNATLIEKLEVLSYMLNLDFSMKITRYNQDNKDIDLKLGENEFFFIEPVITFLQGICYKLAPKFQVNNELVTIVDFHIQLKSGETNQDGCIPVHLDFILPVHLDHHTSGSSRPSYLRYI